MQFGKTNDLSQLNPTLPPLHPHTLRTLQGQNATRAMQIYLGATGWSMKEWVGRVYPKGTKPAQYLTHYAQQFNTIELNTTHYRIPSAETVQQWRESVPSDFRFCPKLPQSISHRNDLGLSNDETTRFCAVIADLREQLGCCFMQLPPHFDATRLPILQRFLKQFPQEIPLAIELRHASWFEETAHFEAFLELLTRYGVSTVITDVAGRRDVLHQALTNTTAMVRFVGNGLHETDFSRLTAWAERLRLWQTQGVQKVFFFPHQPDNILAPDCCVYFAETLQGVGFEAIRSPKLLDGQAGEQISLF